MTASKINQADAQEWLESLQQVGEGWWRQAHLALNMGAHRALGMEPRAFVLAIGRQRTLDAADAVIEMKQSGTSVTRISDILGLSYPHVQKILAENGLIEITAKIQRMLDTGKTEPDRNPYERGDFPEETPTNAEIIDAEVVADDETDELRDQVDTLNAKIRNERRKVQELKAQIGEYQEELYNAEAKARADAEAGLTAQERERAKKEADAWAHAQGEQIIASMAHVFVVAAIDSLHEASEALQQLVDRGGVTTDDLAQLEEAHTTFVEQFNIVRMSELA